MHTVIDYTQQPTETSNVPTYALFEFMQCNIHPKIHQPRAKQSHTTARTRANSDQPEVMPLWREGQRRGVLSVEIDVSGYPRGKLPVRLISIFSSNQCIERQPVGNNKRYDESYTLHVLIINPIINDCPSSGRCRLRLWCATTNATRTHASSTHAAVR